LLTKIIIYNNFNNKNIIYKFTVLRYYVLRLNSFSFCFIFL